MPRKTAFLVLALIAGLQAAPARADVITPPCGYDPGCGCNEWYVPAEPPCVEVPCDDCGPPQPCAVLPCACDDWTAKPLDGMPCRDEPGPLHEMPGE